MFGVYSSWVFTESKASSSARPAAESPHRSAHALHSLPVVPSQPVSAEDLGQSRVARFRLQSRESAWCKHAQAVINVLHAACPLAFIVCYDASVTELHIARVPFTFVAENRHQRGPAASDERLRDCGIIRGQIGIAVEHKNFSPSNGNAPTHCPARTQQCRAIERILSSVIPQGLPSGNSARIFSPRYPTHNTTLCTPRSCNKSSWCARNGRSAMGKSALGIFSVTGRKRVASPPLRIATGRSRALIGPVFSCPQNQTGTGPRGRPPVALRVAVVICPWRRRGEIRRRRRR